MTFHHRSDRKMQKPFKKISKHKTRQKALKALHQKEATKKALLTGHQKLNKLKQLRRNKIKARFKQLSAKASIPKLCAVIPMTELDFFGPIENSYTEETVNNTTFLHLSPSIESMTLLDIAKVADILVFQFTFENKEIFSEAIDNPQFLAFFSKIFRTLLFQGLPTPVALILLKLGDGLTNIVQTKQFVTKKISALFSPLFNQKIKTLFSLGNSQKTVSHSFESLSPSPLTSREQRPYLLAQDVRVVDRSDSPLLSVRGFLRGGRALDVNRKVLVSGFGLADVVQVTEVSSTKVSSPSPFSDVQKGESADEQTDVEMTDQQQLFARLRITENELQEPDFDIERLKFDFPDEVETPTDKPARLRFVKYRGLQDFRRSPWEENDPVQKPPAFKRFLSRQKHSEAAKESHRKDSLSRSNCVQPLQEVSILIRLPLEKTQGILRQWRSDRRPPLILSGTLPLENELSVLHFRLKLADKGVALRNKEKYNFHFGFVKFAGRPILSLGFGACDKYLVQKTVENDNSFFHASVVGPVSLVKGPVFVTDTADSQVLAHGSFEEVDPDRLLIKKVLLTGYPAKCKNNKAIVRLMFFSPLDVKWFSSVELSTKQGLVGNIKCSVGTHGNMKCVFSAAVKSNDIVCLPLYKRVFPPENGVSSSEEGVSQAELNE